MHVCASVSVCLYMCLSVCLYACVCLLVSVSFCGCLSVCVLMCVFFSGADHTHSRMLFLSLPSLSLTSLMRSAPPSPRRLLLPSLLQTPSSVPSHGQCTLKAPTSGQNPVQLFPRIFSEALYLPNNLDVATDSSRSNQWIRLPRRHTHTVAWRVAVGSPQGFCSCYHTGPEDKGHWA